jgi:hypothetical protein
MLSDDPDHFRGRLLTAIKAMRGKPKMVMFRVDR